MIVGVPERDHEFLIKISDGRSVLDVGTGECVSANLFAKQATKVTTIENDPRFAPVAEKSLDPSVEFVLGEWDSVDGEYDIVFVDSFPINQRAHIAKAWRWRGSDVFIHDADIIERETPLDGHRHGDILHINKECRYGD